MNKKRSISIFFLLLACAILFRPFASAQEAQELQIHSSRYIVIDAATGEVYAQKDAHKQVAIASLTKLFTAVQALNMAPLDKVFTTSEFDLRPDAATVMGISPNEKYTLKDLLYGLLLPSGNDAAYTLARNLGHQDGLTDQQSVDRFVSLMNQRAADMGLKDTHLVNPDGWGVKGHYSSAADVAAFMDYAQQYPIIMQIIGTASYTTSDGALTVGNTNKSLNTYPDLIGGKTGVDDDSGWCLVNIAERNSQRMIAVTLDGVAPDDWYDDNTTLLDYGFAQKALYTTGGKKFSGDHVSWTSPDLKQLAEAGNGKASIIGVEQTTSTRDETANVSVKTTESRPASEVSRPVEPTTTVPKHSTWWWPAITAGLVVLAAGGARIGRPWRLLRGVRGNRRPSPVFAAGPPPEPATIASVLEAASDPTSDDVTVLQPVDESTPLLDTTE